MVKRAFWISMFITVLVLSLGSAVAQNLVQIVVTNETANVRVLPALGAEVIANVPAGFSAFANARSGDNQWLRIDFNGQEGWLNITTLAILSGDVNSLPPADPRSIPYGGFEAPRSGLTSATSQYTATTRDWLRLRAGPSTGYPTLTSAPINSSVFLLGRTASNGWIQVSFEGKLGWVSIQFLEFQVGFTLDVLPIDGIVADGQPPAAGNAQEAYVNVLKFMRERLDLAQPSLDTIRASWTDASLTGRASCASPYPARPSDYRTVEVPTLAANYYILTDLLVLFNDAMANVRRAIDLFIDACNQPGGGNPVGVATVSGALETVALADAQFAELRRRLADLIPPDRVAGPGECLLTFNGATDILTQIVQNQIYPAVITDDDRILGFCFDATQGEVLQVAVTRALNSNLQPFVAVAPLDNPSAFIATGRTGDGSLSVAPISIPATGRYLLIISDLADGRSEALIGNFFFTVYNITTLNIIPQLVIDPATGQAVIGGLPGPTPVGATAIPATPGGVTSCPSLAFTCNQLFSCAEAQACYAAGNFSLDDDGDTIPCEQNLCTGN